MWNPQFPFVAVFLKLGVTAHVPWLVCVAMAPKASLRLVSGLEGVSDRALSRVVAALRERPDLVSAPSSYASFSRTAPRLARDVGSIKHHVTLTRGGALEWQVLALQDVLPYLCRACPHFRQLLGEVFAEFGAEWRLILYCDGVTPGAVLAPELNRKSIIWYASLLEFGSKLCHQELWNCLACLETAVAKLVAGQVSSLTRVLVRDMVCGDRAMNNAGIVLPVGPSGRPERVLIRYHATLADEEALSSMLDLKGASGVVPCAMRCWCVDKQKPTDAARNLRPLSQIAPAIVDITCTDKAKILLKCDADVWEDCDHLAAHGGDAGIAVSVGINYHANGILFDRELRQSFGPSSSHRYDPLHILFSNGLVPAEIINFFQQLAEAHRLGKLTFGPFRAYAERCGWQSRCNQSVQRVFGPGKEKPGGTSLKVSAQDLLALYPLLREWALRELSSDAAMRPALTSLLLLLDVVDLVVEAATASRLDDAAVTAIADRLDETVFAYLQAFADAYGHDEMKHKHHELVHLAEQLRKDKRLLWCFTAERKHILAKAVMEHNKSLQDFGFGAVSRMLMAQVGCLLAVTPHWESSLLGETLDFYELGDGARLSKRMRWEGVAVSTGDPVFLRAGFDFLILVTACFAVGGGFGILGHRCVGIQGDLYRSEWSVTPSIGRRELVPSDVLHIAAWQCCIDV